MTASKIYPPGRYYVGDLCYLSMLDWQEFCDKTTDERGNCAYGDFTISRRETWHHHTAYGDGGYPSNQGLMFLVDAGLIGLCPLLPGEEAPHGGHVLEAKLHFRPSYDRGTFFIEALEIYTGDLGEGDEHDEGCDEA